MPSSLLEKLPEWLPIAIVALCVIASVAIIGGIWIHKDGESKGALHAEMKPVDAQLNKMPAKIKAADKAKAVSRAAAGTAHLKSAVSVARALELNAQAHDLPDSALAGVPPILLTAAAATEQAMMDAVTENHALWQYVADDSVADLDRAVNDSLKDRKIEILEKEKNPRCGAKCGGAIVVVGGTLLAWVAHLIAHAVTH